MIVRFEYEKTPEHERELAANAELVRVETRCKEETINSLATLEDYYKHYFEEPLGKEFARSVEDLGKGKSLRILDMGVGRGETSFYLVDQGHNVSALEPSVDFCEVMENVCRKFNKNLEILNCCAEQLNIPGGEFDAVIFNVSLHHCDDPGAALETAFRLLRSGGTLLLVSEPMLPFFRSHERAQQLLEEFPEEYGHYDGNEHTYHYSEYVGFIKRAGFREVKTQIVARYRSIELIRKAMAADKRRPGIAKEIKKLYLHFIHLLSRPVFKPVLFLAERLSLVQLTFTAAKP
jgi:ubiquinone/menaquinone biosynthesis C-methylase UbiE